ncbi:MAG: S-adenosylmethionine synthetase N-terminal domain-containing protein [Desulfobacterales bacterium]|jgi:S-adenosylmethionine synthetase
MVQVTFFFTSKPVIDQKTDDYPDIISNSIEKEVQNKDPGAEVNCTTRIKHDMAIIAGEIEADTSIDASKVVRKTINRLFKKGSLYSET